MDLNLNLDFVTELTDTKTDHLGWRELCRRLVQAAKLVQEDVRVEIATRDAAQVNDWNDATNENDINDKIYMIVICPFVDFFNPQHSTME